MTTYTSTREIAAPVNLVFETVARIENFSKAIPHIINVEFLSDERSGVGTRFKETRIMGGREATTELEIKEFSQDEQIRIVSDTHGTVWDTVFRVEPKGEGTQLSMVMIADAYTFLARIMNMIIKGKVQAALDEDMDAVKQYCETQMQAVG